METDRSASLFNHQRARLPFGRDPEDWRRNGLRDGEEVG
jgi:hypothetical protein